jgi:hypothetical protein
MRAGPGRRLDGLFASPVVWCLLAMASTLVPFLLHWGEIGVGDFDQFAVFQQIALWWYEVGTWQTTWNPFLCGGATLVGNPQIPLFHANMLWFATLGPVRGVGPALVTWMGFGFLGMWCLLRDLGIRKDVAAWVGTAWIVQGFFVAQLGTMHILYTACYGLPGWFWLHRRIVHDGYRWALAAVPLAFALHAASNHHFLAYTLPFVPLHFLLEWIGARRRSFFDLAGYLGGLALGLGLVAAYFLPSLSWSRQFPRFKPPEFVHPLDLLQSLLFPLPAWSFPRDHDIHEYILTFGPVLVGLAVFGLARGALRRAGPVLAAGAIAALTAVGTFEGLGLPAVGPFDLLRDWVPGFRAIRVPTRFFVVSSVGLAVAAAHGWQALLRKAPRARSWNRWLVGTGVLPLVLFNFGYHQWSLFSEIRGTELASVEPEVTSEWEWAESGHRFTMMQVLRPNVGVLDCYEALEVPQASALSADVGFVLDASTDVRVDRRGWGHFELHRTNFVPSKAPARVVMNFNHHRGWTVTRPTDEGTRIVSSTREPLTVNLSPSTGSVILRHRDPAWTCGLRISGVSAVLAIGWVVLLLRSRRSEPRSSAASAAVPTSEDR